MFSSIPSPFSATPGKHNCFQFSNSLPVSHLHALLRQRLAWLLPVSQPFGNNLPQCIRARHATSASSNVAASSIAVPAFNQLRRAHTPPQRQASAGVSAKASKSSSNRKGRSKDVGGAAHPAPLDSSKGCKGTGAVSTSSSDSVEIPEATKAGTKHSTKRSRGRPPGSGTKTSAPLAASRESLQQKRRLQVRHHPSSTVQEGSMPSGEQAHAQLGTASYTDQLDSATDTGLARSTSKSGSRRARRSSSAVSHPSSNFEEAPVDPAATQPRPSRRTKFSAVSSDEPRSKIASELLHPAQLAQQSLQPNAPSAAATPQQHPEPPMQGNPQARSLHAARTGQHHMGQPTQQTPQQRPKQPSQQIPQLNMEQPSQETPQQHLEQPSQQIPRRNMEPTTTKSPKPRSLHAARKPQQRLKHPAQQAPQRQSEQPLPPADTSQKPSKPTTMGSMHTTIASIGPGQHTSSNLEDPHIQPPPSEHRAQPTASLKVPKHHPPATSEESKLFTYEHRAMPTAVLKDPKQLTALIRHCCSLGGLADLLHRHCGISISTRHSTLYRTRDLDGTSKPIRPLGMSGDGATEREGGGNDGGCAAGSTDEGTGRLTRGRRRRTSSGTASAQTHHNVSSQLGPAEAGGAFPNAAALAGQSRHEQPTDLAPAASPTAPAAPSTSPQPPHAASQLPACLDGVALSAALHRLAVLAQGVLSDGAADTSNSSGSGRISSAGTSHENGRHSSVQAPAHTTSAASHDAGNPNVSSVVSRTASVRSTSASTSNGSKALAGGAAPGNPALPKTNASNGVSRRAPLSATSAGTSNGSDAHAHGAASDSVDGADGAASGGTSVAASDGVASDNPAFPLPSTPPFPTSPHPVSPGSTLMQPNAAAAKEALARDGNERSLHTLGGLEDAQRLAAVLLDAGVNLGLIQDMGWRELSSLLWSAARLGLRPQAHAGPAQDLQPSAAAAFAAAQQPGPGGRAAEAKAQSQPLWVNAVLQRMASIGFHAADAQALSNTIWALSRLGIVPGPAWIRNYLQAIQASLPRLQAQHLTNILYALAKLHLLQGAKASEASVMELRAESGPQQQPPSSWHDMDEPALRGVQQQQQQQQEQQEGRLEGVFPPSEAWVSAFLQEVYHAMPDPSTLVPPIKTGAEEPGGGNARVMGKHRGSFKQTHSSHDANLQPKLQQQQQQQQEQLLPQQQQQQQASARASAGPSFLMSTPQQYANLLYALAIFAAPPPSLEWLARFWAASAALLRPFPSVSQANPVPAPPGDNAQQHQTQQHHARHLSSLQLWQRQRQQVQLYPSSAVRPQHLSNLVWATAKLRACAAMPCPPVWWMQAVERQLRHQAPLLSPQELANVAYAYGLMWSKPRYPNTLPLLLSWALQHARWGQLTPQGAANIVWGAARIHIARDPSQPHPAGDGGGDHGSVSRGDRWASIRAAVLQSRSQPTFDGVWLRQLLQAFQQHRVADGPPGAAFAREKEGSLGYCSGFTAQAAANILWGAAIVGADPGEEEVQWLTMQATGGAGQEGVPRVKRLSMQAGGAGKQGGPRVAAGAVLGSSTSSSSSSSGSNQRGIKDVAYQELWGGYGQPDGKESRAPLDGDDTNEGEKEGGSSSGGKLKSPAGRQIRWALLRLGYKQAPPQHSALY